MSITKIIACSSGSKSRRTSALKSSGLSRISIGRIVLVERESLWSPVELEYVRRLLKLSLFQTMRLLDAEEGVLW